MRRGGARDPHHELVRVLRGVSGTVHFDVCLRPRFDYGWTAPMLRQVHEDTYTAVGGAEAMVIHTDVDARHRHGGRHDRRRVRGAGRLDVRFLLTSRAAHEIAEASSELADAGQRLEQTVGVVATVVGDRLLPGPHESRCATSVRVLKGLTCAPTGAIVAAATTSLPEEVGGQSELGLSVLVGARLVAGAGGAGRIGSRRDRRRLPRLPAALRRRQCRRPADHVRRVR